MIVLCAHCKTKVMLVGGNICPRCRRIFTAEETDSLVEANEFNCSAIDSTRDGAKKKEYGGIGRFEYFLGTVAIAVAGVIIYFAAGNLYISSACMLPFGFMLGMSRLKNIGMNKWYALFALIPLLSTFFGIWCQIVPEGYEHTKKLDTTAKAIGGLIIGGFCLAVLVLLGK